MDANTFVLVLLFLAGALSVGLTIRDIARDVRDRRTH